MQALRLNAQGMTATSSCLVLSLPIKVHSCATSLRQTFRPLGAVHSMPFSVGLRPAKHSMCQSLESSHEDAQTEGLCLTVTIALVCNRPGQVAGARARAQAADAAGQVTARQHGRAAPFGHSGGHAAHGAQHGQRGGPAQGVSPQRERPRLAEYPARQLQQRAAGPPHQPQVRPSPHSICLEPACLLLASCCILQLWTLRVGGCHVSLTFCSQPWSTDEASSWSKHHGAIPKASVY